MYQNLVRAPRPPTSPPPLLLPRPLALSHASPLRIAIGIQCTLRINGVAWEEGVLTAAPRVSTLCFPCVCRRLDKPDAEGHPQLARTLRVFSPKFPAVPVTSFTVLEDL